MQSKNIIY